MKSRTKQRLNRKRKHREELLDKRKGLTRINELTPTEYDMLEDYRNDIVYEQETNARIASILKDKKFEIMINLNRICFY